MIVLPMKTLPWPLLAIAALTSFAVAQNNPPARTGPPAPTASPEIQSDRKVTFRFRAQEAREVTVAGQGISGKVAMTKGDNGEWSATVGPIEPGIYEYSF